jgi:hypothetical protein
MKNFRNLFFLSSLLVGLMACQPSSDSSVSSPLAPTTLPADPVLPLKSEVALAEVSTEACLNLEKYILAIQSLNPSPFIRQVTTDVNFSSPFALPKNFTLRLAYGNFGVEETTFASISYLKPVEQTNCETVIIKNTSNQPEVYKITQSSPTLLKFENESGEIYTYEWINPQELKVRVTHDTGDFLCNERSTINVQVARTLSWNPDFIQAANLPENYINSNLLAMVVDATAFPAETLVLNPETDRRLAVPALKEMSQQILREDLLNCQ